MAREVDKRKTRKALKRLKRASDRAAEAEQTGGKGLTSWEKDFVAGVSERLETYGSAFRDPAKGALEEALSQRQTAIARAIERKSRPKSENPGKGGSGRDGEGARKTGSTFKRKAPPPRGRVRDINDDMSETPPAPGPAALAPAPSRKAGPPRLTVISGGRKD